MADRYGTAERAALPNDAHMKLVEVIANTFSNQGLRTLGWTAEPQSYGPYEARRLRAKAYHGSRRC